MSQVHRQLRFKKVNSTATVPPSGYVALQNIGDRLKLVLPDGTENDVIPRVFTGTLAAVTTSLSGNHNDLTFTSKLPGTLGNSITVTYFNPGVANTLSVSVSGYSIFVNLGHSGSAITSTAAQVKAAIENHLEANALVTVTKKADDDGVGTTTNLLTGVVTAMAETALTSGATGAPVNAAAATLTTSMTGADNDIVLTARPKGAAGNDITIELVDPGEDKTSETVAVTGTNIVVTLRKSTATLSTATQLVAALKASLPAMRLVTAAVKGGDSGAGNVIALAHTHLASGADGTGGHLLTPTR